MTPLVYVIILNYNGFDDTKNCIESVKKSSYPRIKIVVVDNASSDDSAVKLRESFSDCIVLQTESNLGYAGGNNVGIKYALEQGADYICILNNDTLIAENTIEILMNKIISTRNCIVGPATLFWNKEIVHSAGVDINFWKGTSKIHYYGEDVSTISNIEVVCDYLEGTCLLFSTKDFEKIGLLPEIYFMYFEETEWCYRAKQNGIRIVCITNAKLWHKGSASTNKISGMKQKLEDRNRIVFVQRNASNIQKIIFYIYIWTQVVFRLILKKREFDVIKDYIEGYDITKK